MGHLNARKEREGSGNVETPTSLEESEIVIVPTEKTNRFISMKREKYKTMV